MKKILWIATLTVVLALTAFTSISNSPIAGSTQIESRPAAPLPVVAPRGAIPSPAEFLMRSTRYG